MKSYVAQGLRNSVLLLCIIFASAPIRAQSTAVRVIEPDIRDFERVSRQPGTAEAFYEADLGAKVSGYVSELLVDIGDHVAAGTVLTRIAVPDMTAARSALSAEVDALQSERDRAATLVERGALTQRALDEAANRLEAARADLREIDEQLRYATIEAPFDGVVTYRAIDPGDMVYEASSPKGGDQPLLRVARVDVIRVTTFLPELDAVWVNIGDHATVSFDALPGRTFSGDVARVSGSLDPSTRTMQVEIDLPNPDGQILPGLYGRTRVELETHSDALALPATAVRFTEVGESYVYLIGAGSVVSRRSVSIGFDDGNWIEITDGLSRTDRVADGLVGSLSDGEQVQVIGP